MRYGKSSDHLFEMFTEAKMYSDVDQAKHILSIIDAFPISEQDSMSDLREDIDDFINDMEYDYEFA